MQTRSFPTTPNGRSPAGAEIRYLMEGETGGMIHSTVPPGQVNRAETDCSRGLVTATEREQLGVEYNAHAIESILRYVAPELGWR